MKNEPTDAFMPEGEVDLLADHSDREYVKTPDGHMARMKTTAVSKPSHLDRLTDMLAEAETDLEAATSRHTTATEELHAAEFAVESAKEVTNILRTAVEQLTPAKEPEPVKAEEPKDLTVADWIALHMETYGPGRSHTIRLQLAGDVNVPKPIPSIQKINAVLKQDGRFYKVNGSWFLVRGKTDA